MQSVESYHALQYLIDFLNSMAPNYVDPGLKQLLEDGQRESQVTTEQYEQTAWNRYNDGEMTFDQYLAILEKVEFNEKISPPAHINCRSSLDINVVDEGIKTRHLYDTDDLDAVLSMFQAGSTAKDNKSIDDFDAMMAELDNEPDNEPDAFDGSRVTDEELISRSIKRVNDLNKFKATNDTTYIDWLKTQSKLVQLDLLGPETYVAFVNKHYKKGDK